MNHHTMFYQDYHQVKGGVALIGTGLGPVRCQKIRKNIHKLRIFTATNPLGPLKNQVHPLIKNSIW